MSAPTPRLVPDRPSDATEACATCCSMLWRTAAYICPDPLCRYSVTRPSDAAAPPAEAPAERGDDFAAWWLKNVPSGTVISNPEWWLTRIRRFMAAAPAAPAGEWVMVPRGTTEAMRVAGADAFTNVDDIWAAMLAAAPAAPATDTRVTGGREDWRELTRRLFVELLWCDRQLTEKKVQQGGSVRDALADALAALEGRTNDR